MKTKVLLAIRKNRRTLVGHMSEALSLPRWSTHGLRSAMRYVVPASPIVVRDRDPGSPRRARAAASIFGALTLAQCVPSATLRDEDAGTSMHTDTGGSSAKGSGAGTGGTTRPLTPQGATGGNSLLGTSVSGGSHSIGGVPGLGGTIANGGTSAFGSVAPTGGVPATGTKTATGGVIATGGAATTGGAIATGGAATGSAATTGGVFATGGVAPTGGAAATGGAIADGGSAATGGVIATGGGAQTGGSQSSLPCTGSVAFEYTGAAQTFVVPTCATKVTIQAHGAEGGTAFNRTEPNPFGGKGAYVSALLAVTGGETLSIYVGGRGGDGTRDAGGLGGWNGGGDGGYADASSWTAAAAGGGGATDVRRGGSALSNRIIVASGGGGAAGNCSNGLRPFGGDGGIDRGADGGLCYSEPSSSGTGGTRIDGGLGGNYSDCVSQDGALGYGGLACSVAGGGGGGGYYGGGAGAWGGGGGGSSYVIAGATVLQTTAGERTGNGFLIISW